MRNTCLSFIYLNIFEHMSMRHVFCLLFRVVKEEIKDDESGLPCVNGRVVAWVRLEYKFSNLI